MINSPVVDALTVGSPVSRIGGLNVFGDSTITGVLNVGTLAVANSFTITSDVVTTQTGSVSIVDTFDTVSYRSAQYSIQISGRNAYHSTTVYLLQDEDDVFTTEQGTLFNKNLGTFSGNLQITNANTNKVNLLFTPTTSELLTLKVMRIAFVK